MTTTVECLACKLITDIEETSDTNPSRCPKCGETIVYAGTETPYIQGGITRSEMAETDKAIAAAMCDLDVAELIGDNEKRGDARVRVYRLKGTLVASTNGNPVWYQEDAAGFAALCAEEGIEI